MSKNRTFVSLTQGHVRRILSTTTWAMFLLLGVSLGCSKKTEVTGLVTIDDKPVEVGLISFLPADGKGPTAGNVIAGGQYKVEMLPGKKLVRIEGSKVVGTIKVPLGSRVIETPDKRPVVPKKYNTESTLEVDVDSANRKHDFPLVGALKVRK